MVVVPVESKSRHMYFMVRRRFEPTLAGQRRAVTLIIEPRHRSLDIPYYL